MNWGVCLVDDILSLVHHRVSLAAAKSFTIFAQAL
jgi:hypothetical protein